MTVTIYHNPNCSKSRQTLELIKSAGHKPVVVEYLKTPPNADDLSEITDRLGIKPRDLLRKTEAQYKELNLSDETLSNDALINAMIEHPKLIERPIVLTETEAIIGRPPENVLALL